MIANSKLVKSIIVSFMAILIVFSQFFISVPSPALAANSRCQDQQSENTALKGLATVGTGTLAAGGTIAAISAHATVISAGATILAGTTAAVLAAPVAIGGGAALATYAIWEAVSPDCDSQANKPKHNDNLWDQFTQRK